MATENNQGTPVLDLAGKTPEEANQILLTHVINLQNQLLTQRNANGRGGKKRTPKPVMDTKTGKVYHSHAAAGMAVAPEYGMTVNNFVWYAVIAKDPKRFKDISSEEYTTKLEAQNKPAPAKSGK